MPEREIAQRPENGDEDGLGEDVQMPGPRQRGDMQRCPLGQSGSESRQQNRNDQKARPRKRREKEHRPDGIVPQGVLLADIVESEKESAENTEINPHSAESISVRAAV